jgi:hypothetical protein
VGRFVRLRLSGLVVIDVVITILVNGAIQSFLGVLCRRLITQILPYRGAEAAGVSSASPMIGEVGDGRFE